MRAVLIGLLTALLAGCSTLQGSAPAAQGSPVIARIVANGALRVGMSGDQPPLNFKSRGGRMMGLEVDITRGLAAMMGVEPRFVEMPFGELIGALERGEVDLVISGVTITPARNMKVPFVGPYQISGKSILTKSSTLAKADETTDLDQPSLRLAALSGSTSEEFVKAFLPKATLKLTENYESAIEMLRKGEVQAVVADYEICALSVLRYPDEGLVTLARPLTVEPLGIAVAPGPALPEPDAEQHRRTRGLGPLRRTARTLAPERRLDRGAPLIARRPDGSGRTRPHDSPGPVPGACAKLGRGTESAR